MPRRSQREAVAERMEARLADQQERRRQAAQRSAQTRRQRREAQAAEAQPQAGVESRTQGHVARRPRQRVHADLMTVAIRGHFAERMRALAESTGMSLARLLKDALLVYERDMESGYEPGTSLRQWEERATADGEQGA